jgi:hypothetical protein
MAKTLTRDQLQSRKDKAVRFVQDVLQDPERADEIADESLESYAERRKIALVNPVRRRDAIMTKQELLGRVQDLEDENQQLQDQLDAVADIVNPDDDGDAGDDQDNDDDDSGDSDDDEEESTELD